jgi:branched-chain amino acid aminotransferase
MNLTTNAMNSQLIPFDDRDGMIWLDGRLVPWREAKIHVLTHGLHYASSVFEGERIYSGRIFKLREHSQRLLESARMLGFEIPYSLDQIESATQEVVAASKIQNGYIRPIAWRGSEILSVAARASKIHLAIAVWAWPSYFNQQSREQGLKLQLSRWARPAPNTAPTKSKASGLYMICTLSKHAAEVDGFDDALMLDYRGYIAEATGANVFFVMDGELHTPIPDCFLDGITRRTVIELARGKGLRVIERHIKPEELKNASEVFLTGTAAEIAPVGQIEIQIYQERRITKMLVADFHDLVRQNEVPQPLQTTT